MQSKMGSATVSVAAIAVSPMASSARTANQMVRLLSVRSGRRDVDQSARDARDPQNGLHGYGSGEREQLLALPDFARSLPSPSHFLISGSSYRCADAACIHRAA